MAKSDKILIFGATSAIAFETEKLLAKEEASFYLCARNEADLERLSSDLAVRGAKEVFYSTYDALDSASVIKAVDNCLMKFPDLDRLLIASGTTPDQQLCENNYEEMKKVIDINFTSAATILNYIAPHFEKQGCGTIVVISSVAGDRGRQSNYAYGATKGALSVFASGLRQRLHKSGVNVITVKPGFVDTPMTANIRKSFLFVGPNIIAKGIYNAMLKGKSVVYLPRFWRLIMMIIKNLPEKIYNKIKL